MKIVARTLLAVIVVLAAGAAGFAAFAWRSELPPLAGPPPAADPARVERGRELAAIGNCNVCHTAAGGAPFAGGLPMPTPFGTIHSTNITPDPDTGIGRWSLAAFTRAMRDGVDREGRHLYPAFPYDHFALMTDGDIAAVYDYLMTRRPVTAPAPPNELPFPLNIRMLVAGWNLLFHHGEPLQPDPSRSEEWNRGRYLAEGVGHCGACHTPRNALGAEMRDRRFAGARIEGWYAYAINDASPAPVPWSADALTAYLRRGWHEKHGVSRGPMAPVTANLGSVPEADVRAIATYIASGMGAADRTAPPEAATAATGGTPPAAPAGDDPGAAIYGAACAICHEDGRPPPFGGLDLRLSTAVHGASPQNIINVTLFGIPAPDGEAGPIMPGFAGAFDADQMTALLDHLRRRFTDRPAWDDARRLVEETLSGETAVTVYSADGVAHTPATFGQRASPWQ